MAKKGTKSEKAAEQTPQARPSLEVLAEGMVRATSGDPNATVRQLGTREAHFELSITKAKRGGTIGKGGQTIRDIKTILIEAAKQLNRQAGKDGARIFVSSITVLEPEKGKK